MKHARIWVLALLLSALALPATARQTPPEYTRQEDVIYGRKVGVALTMDVFKPKANANGAAVIFCVSGGWVSSHDNINFALTLIPELIKRGYTVFAVVHGSQPKFTIPEILQDMHRAVRYIRTNAATFGVDPNRLGITGGSAGGHLSLMQGTAGDMGKADAKDPVEKASSRVQAVACFFPPTDFMNYGQSGRNPFSDTKVDPMYKPFRPPFDFHELNTEQNLFDRITDPAKLLEIIKAISPITHVTADDPPTLIIHGDKDFLVPIQQAQIMVDKLKKAGVQAHLEPKPGLGHGWQGMDKDMVTVADWFDKYLTAKTAAGAR
jgi:acetyl esterase/lipase